MRSFIKNVSLAQWYFLVGGFMALVVVFTVATTPRESQDPPPKPIKFSHQFHVGEAGLGCTDCHESAPTSVFASENLLAKKANCQSCHEEQLEQNCTYCHTSDDVSTYRALQPADRELIFSHKFHVEGQAMACETCHKGIEKAEAFSLVSHLPEMATCNTCHNDVKASNACESCHTNMAALRPLTHNRTDFMREHKMLARISDASCASCHTQESCIDCHTSTGLVNVDLPGRDLMSPRMPRLTAIDRGQTMALGKVHDLNFRFTHGITAKGKASDCQTCHTTQDQSCADCHLAGGNINQLRFKPKSHDDPVFVTIGVGTGGGKHALFARRDMESCASCHDAQGADPTCITCHLDADGIKGTDPRTHPRGFMTGVNGPWHYDHGSTCFTCHSDPNARAGGLRGQGFCGYCHN
jgi:hypothetical protein